MRAPSASGSGHAGHGSGEWGRSNPPPPGPGSAAHARQRAHGRSRTSDLQSRKPSLYPLSYVGDASSYGYRTTVTVRETRAEPASRTIA